MAPRRVVEYIELDVPVCSLQCRVHPCRAVASGVFTIADADFSYNFNDGTSSLKGWGPAQGSGGPVTLTGGAAYATLAMNGATIGFISKGGLSFNADNFGALRINLRRTANGTAFNGFVDYVTAAGYFRTNWSAQNPPLGVDTTVVVPKAGAVAAGGESGTIDGKTITGIVIHFDFTGSGAFRLYSIDVGTWEAGATEKCFNTLASCQDEARYTEVEETMRFAKDNGALDLFTNYAIPIVTDISFTPGKLAISENTGERSTLSVTMKDRPHSDVGPGFDPYYAERSYDPYHQGTLLGKFRARQPYLQDRVIRYIRGYDDQLLADMQTRTFIVTKTEMTGVGGGFLIQAQDVLKQLDGRKSQAPAQTNGYLSADINSSVTSFTMSPSGIGNLEYASAGWVSIGGREIVSFTRVNDTMTITRGQLGTVAVSHSAQDRVQQVLYYVAEDVADVVDDLLTNYTPIRPEWIPLTEWQLETGSYLQVNATGVIAEPTPVDQLISELCKDFAMSLWWDDLQAKVRLQVLRPINSLATINAENRVNGSFQIEEQPNKRQTQVWVYYGKINPLESDTKPENYRSMAMSLDLKTQSRFGQPAIEKIFSRWMPPGSRSIALRRGELGLSRYKSPPRLFKMEVMQRDTEEEDAQLSMGAGVDIESWSLQNLNGSAASVQAQIVRFDPNPTKQKIEAEEYVFTTEVAVGDRIIIVETNEFNYNLRQKYDSLYPPPNSATLVKLYILSGVTIGSVSTALRAFETGSWPVGCDIEIYLDGRIQGAGGRGGDGTDADQANGRPGGVGFYTRHPVTIFGTGRIYGGGGGGGGGGVGTDGFGGKINGGRGGGGAGVVGGLAGSGKNPNNPGTANNGGDGGQGTTSIINAGGGGDGGDPGQAGQNGGGGLGGNGGAGGAAVDGNSYVSGAGSIIFLGSRIN